jgi:hypothetical protein
MCSDPSLLFLLFFLFSTSLISFGKLSPFGGNMGAGLANSVHLLFFSGCAE